MKKIWLITMILSIAANATLIANDELSDNNNQNNMQQNNNNNNKEEDIDYVDVFFNWVVSSSKKFVLEGNIAQGCGLIGKKVSNSSIGKKSIDLVGQPLAVGGCFGASVGVSLSSGIVGYKAGDYLYQNGWFNNKIILLGVPALILNLFPFDLFTSSDKTDSKKEKTETEEINDEKEKNNYMNYLKKVALGTVTVGFLAGMVHGVYNSKFPSTTIEDINTPIDTVTDSIPVE